jgi:hypothetical protein
MDHEQIHGEARLQVALAKMEGHKFDKALTRWNDIVETAEFYNNPRDGLTEAIECCIIGNVMHVPGRGPLTMIEMFK